MTESQSIGNQMIKKRLKLLSVLFNNRPNQQVVQLYSNRWLNSNLLKILENLWMLLIVNFMK